MKQIFHAAGDRGYNDLGWLKSHHSFSFSRYHDPARMGFGKLRVLNDDVVNPLTGFGSHGHDNMEIISIPLSGALRHRDNTGHEQIIHFGEVQVMSAGTGIFHSEFNASVTEPVNFLQLWIIPSEQNVKPAYAQKRFDESGRINRWQFLVNGSETEDSLQIHQNARMAWTNLSEGNSLSWKLAEGKGLYVFLISGKARVENQLLNARDASGVSETGEVHISATENSFLLAVEVPMN